MKLNDFSQSLHIIVIVLGSTVLSGCAHQPTPSDFNDPPSFFMGIIHGFLILFSLIGGFFNDDIRVYAFPNSGWWYDLGYVIGVVLFVEEATKKTQS